MNYETSSEEAIEWVIETLEMLQFGSNVNRKLDIFVQQSAVDMERKWTMSEITDGFLPFFELREGTPWNSV